MIGATALHTRAPCDECGDVPATLEGFGGIVICERCDATPPANDDVLGALFGGMLRVPLCSQCSEPAFLRVDSTIILCAECWLKVESCIENDSSFADGQASSGDVTASVSPAPGPSGVVTNNSRYPDPADSIDLDQNVTGGVLIPSMVAEQSGELKAGEMPSATTRVASSPVLRVAVEPAAVEVGCGQAPEFNSIPATALGMRGDAPRAVALPLNVSSAGVDTPSIRDASLEGRGPVEDWTDGCLAVRAVIYPARRGASHRASDSIATGNNPAPTDVLGGEVAGRDSTCCSSPLTSPGGDVLIASLRGALVQERPRVNTIPDAELESIIGWLERQWNPGAAFPADLTSPPSGDAGVGRATAISEWEGCLICGLAWCRWTHGPHPKYAATSAIFAATDSAANSKSASEART